jgi:hypothetical protein
VAPLRLGGILRLKKKPCRCGPLQCFVLPLRRSVKGCKTRTQPRKKAAAKVYHANETLQLFNIQMGGGTSIDCGGAFGLGGGSCPAEMVWPKISTMGTAKMHVSKMMVRPSGGQKQKTEPADG